jgi:hypothetical protein
MHRLAACVFEDLFEPVQFRLSFDEYPLFVHPRFLASSRSSRNVSVANSVCESQGIVAGTGP